MPALPIDARESSVVGLQGGMLIGEAREIVASLTREQLEGRFPYLLLAVASGVEPLELGYRTEKAPVGCEPRAERITHLLPVVKAPRNPYASHISIGRTRNCDIVLRDPSVSKLHANFFVRAGRMEIADLGSQNGTVLNGRRLRANVAAAVHVGDTLMLGRVSTSLLDAAALYELLR